MPLVSAKCTSCGASLEVDNKKDAAICPYCNTAYIVEKAINNYNITNNISANTVNIFGDVQTDFVNRGGMLTEYRGSKTDVIIPNDHFIEIGYQTKNGEKVGAFQEQRRITKVVIPEGVTIIGDNAFKNCQSLIEVVFPSTLEEIGKEAFAGCTSLSNVSFPKSLKRILFSAFYGCTGLTNLFIPEGVVEVGGFSECRNLSSVVLPNTVSEISMYAFANCKKIRSIVIPSSVKTIKSSAFEYCDSLEELIIPEGVTTIGGIAFYKCTALKKVVIASTVKEIGRGAFCGCSNLSDVTLPKGVKVENNTFEGTPYARGCYIATCVYGSYDCPQVWTLRRYRDNYLSKTIFGRVFVRIYYATSPTLVKWFGTTKWFRKLWRGVLNRWVSVLNNKGIADMPYEDRKW